MRTTWIIFKDEMQGFIRSWVMVTLLIGLPVISILVYFLVPMGQGIEMAPGKLIPMTYFVGLIASGLGGTLAGVMLAVEIVNERNRKVYDLFVIRPLPRGAILWAKFAAVVLCVSFACLLALGAGIIVDLIRGANISWLVIKSALEALETAVGTMMVSAAGGVLVGILSSSVLIAVLLVMYVTQNLTIVPQIPALLGLPDYVWVSFLASIVLSLLIMWGAVFLFKRKEL